MEIGFVSAILAELSLKEVVEFAADEGFACVEPMCWPPGGADRRYAGVTHIDVRNMTEKEGDKIRGLFVDYGVHITGLGYYPNPLHPDADHRRTVVEHLKQVITAAPMVGALVVNTFIGRDQTKTVEDNWPLMREVWGDIIRHAETMGVTLGIENCPMLFSNDEWPGGQNLATTPAIWRKLFDEFPTRHLGLNFDPSHLVWQYIDCARWIREFGKRIVHFHAKDARIDTDRLYEVGIMGLKWHTPKIPGLGDVDWTALFSALTDAGYKGPICIEVEDRAYEGSLADRKRALRQSKRFLEQFLG